METWKILLSVLLLVLVYLYGIYKKKANFFTENGVPTVKSIPFFGSMAPWVLGQKSFAELIRNFYYSAPPDARYVGFMNFTEPNIIFRDVELLNQVTIKNFDHFTDHQPFGDIQVDPLFAIFLFSMKGQSWHAMRTKLSPSFTTLKMKIMFQIMTESSVEFANYVESRCAVPPFRIDTKDVFSKLTNDIFLATVFGMSTDFKKDPENDIYSKGRDLTSTGYFRLMKTFLTGNPLGLKMVRLFNLSLVSKKVQNFFRDIIASNVIERRSKGVVRPDMIQSLMEAKSGAEKRGLTMEEITAQALLAYFAGYDTVSTGLCSTVYLLATNPHVQEKLQAAIDRVRDATGGNVGYEDLQQLKYMDAVINEALRIFPPFSQIDRVCTKRYELPPALPGLRPLVVEPGTVCHLPLLSIHRDPKYFPKPEEFVPERFISENGHFKEPVGYYTFGRGPRSCLGNRYALVEMKVILFHLLSKTTLKTCDKTIPPTRFCQAVIQYNPLDNIVLQIESRTSGK